MTRRPARLAVALVLATALPAAAAAPSPATAAAVQRLRTAAPGEVTVATARATGAARLVELAPGALDLGRGPLEEQARQLFRDHGAAFGLDDDSELIAGAATTDRLGRLHQSFTQSYRGVPVWGAVLRVHGDASGRLATVNGTAIPAIAPLAVEPTVAVAAAETTALSAVAKARPTADWPRLNASSQGLTVVHSGLARGVAGPAHLTWEVVVRDGDLALERVFVDAHDGTIVNRVSELRDIHRRVYNVNTSTLIWSEGDPLPYSGDTPSANTEINTIIAASKDTYDLFAALSGGAWLSWDGADAPMPSIYRADFIECPNAMAVGNAVGFCPGLAVDDVVGHEWVHNYTGATHNLIYQWQPGALNESYSDIFGETVDLLHTSGSEGPVTRRSDGGCSTFGGSPPASLTITAPAALAGSFTVGDASFNPLPPWSVSGQAELVNASTGEPSLGCGPLTGFTAGHVAVVDRGTCTFVDKVRNAAAAGAVAVIVVNLTSDGVLPMGGTGRQPIPAVLVGRSDGEAIKAALADGVMATIAQAGSTDVSVRWLQGEDAGTIRDQWNPACLGNPGKVSAGEYACSEDDGGGVHTNSGVPNHAYSLLVDGGSFNGVTVAGIGLTRAAHVYWRAMSVYQVPTTDFVDHADLLELSCQDLVGATLTDLATGAPSNETITTGHCAQLALALAAVEMRAEPVQCNFQPLLAAAAPSLEETAEILAEDFASDPVADPARGWTVDNTAGASAYTPRDWAWTAAAPEGADGGAMFATDRDADVGACGVANESGVMHLTSPTFTVPERVSEAILAVDHYVATEGTWDGGNLRIAVNGGPFTLVPLAAFVYNPYTAVLVSAAEGNTNPMAGQPAFTGANDGTFTGSWGQSQVDLLRLAAPGDTLQLRFDFGVDQCFGLDGWYLDAVRAVIRFPAPRRSGGRVGG